MGKESIAPPSRERALQSRGMVTLITLNNIVYLTEPAVQKFRDFTGK